MNILFIYTNLIRVILIIVAIIQLFKRDYKKLIPAAVMMVLTFVPWLMSLINFQINSLTEFLFLTVTLMSVYLGSGYRYYDLFSWWDRVIHFLSGILFFSFGITLAGKAPDAGFVGTLIFSFALSLGLHEIWEVSEFLCDSIFHTDHQHWQKHSAVVNHQPEKAMQPPGLVDTMNDVIAGLAGTIIACVGWWVYMG